INAHAVLHAARNSLGEARMCYLEHWDNSKCLDESMSYQHYFCTAFLSQSRCLAEMGEYDDAVDVFKVGMQQWRERARAIASDRILGNNRSRFLDSRYASIESVPNAKFVGWLDFAYDEQKGYQWLDVIRMGKDSPFLSRSWGRSRKEAGRDVTYLDNLVSRDAILKGYEAQLQFFAEKKIRPSQFANALKDLITNQGAEILFLAPLEDASSLEFDKETTTSINLSLTDLRKEVDSEHNPDGAADIEPDEFLRQLSKLEDENTKNRRRFIGLGWFVKTHLFGLGYAINSSYGIANSLKKKELVEIYQVDTLKGDRSVTAIRLVNSVS
ncbi:MAG: hypothetical protein ACLFN3_09975, partial [Halochromatium sp.]